MNRLIWIIALAAAMVLPVVAQEVDAPKTDSLSAKKVTDIESGHLYVCLTPARWTIKGVTGVNLAQSSFTNWSAGGENTVAANVYLNVAANYKKGKWIWNNSLNTEYGQTYTQANGWRKSLDKIDLTSVGGYQIASKWYASAMANLLTQYDKGYKKPTDARADYISNLFAPAYLNLGLGAEYKPVSQVSIFLSPLTGKLTMVLDDYLSAIGAYGVKPGERTRVEVGPTIVAAVNYDVFKNVNLISKLTLFSAYTNNFGNVDVNWDVMVAMRINSFLSANITTSLVYDDDVKTKDELGKIRGAKVQFKQMLGIGLAYKF